MKSQRRILMMLSMSLLCAATACSKKESNIGANNLSSNDAKYQEQNFLKVVQLQPSEMESLQGAMVGDELVTGEILVDQTVSGELIFLTTTERQVLLSTTHLWMVSGRLNELFAWESLSSGWLITRGDETLELP